jgi:hypothetical protein
VTREEILGRLWRVDCAPKSNVVDRQVREIGVASFPVQDGGYRFPARAAGCEAPAKIGFDDKSS